MKLGRAVLAVLTMGLVAAAAVRGDGGREHRARQTPPIKLGTSGSMDIDFRRNYLIHGPCSAATLGAAVTCNGALHVLTSNFGLVPQDASTPPPPAGQPVLQPGLADTRCRADGTPVATFAGDIVPLCANIVDAAIAAALPGQVDELGFIQDIGIPCSEGVTGAVGMRVAKSGRTTGLTSGVIDAVDVAVRIVVGPGLYGCGNELNFDGQIVIESLSRNAPFADGGDDGALIVTDDANHSPVALLNYPTTTYSFADNFRKVDEAFDAVCGSGGFSLVGRTEGCPTAIASAAGLFGPSTASAEAARSAKQRHLANLMSDPAVVAVGIGASDRSRYEAAIRVYVERRRPLREPIPADLDGVAVTVREIDRPVRK